MSIEFVDLKRQFSPLRAEILAALERTLDGMQLFLGENMRLLEEEFAAYCGVREAVAVASGTDALYLALKAASIEPGAEVITASHTFIATAGAIRQAGAVPVLVDIDTRTFTIDPAAVETAITPRTAAIIPVHLYGQTADMTALCALAARHGLILLEDACQAHGARHRDIRSGGLGAAAAFSFYYSKNLGAYGEGGMVTTNDSPLAARLRLLRNHGSEERYLHSIVGINSRLDEMQAAVLRVKLRHLDDWNAARRRLAAIYDRELTGVPGLGLPWTPPENEHVYHLYVIRTPQRDRLQAALKARGIATGIHYPVPVHLQQAFADLGYLKGALPESEAAAAEVLSLPMFPELTAQEAAWVAACVREEMAQLGSQRAFSAAETAS